jgi:hypothetical protein
MNDINGLKYEINGCVSICTATMLMVGEKLSALAWYFKKIKNEGH